MKSQTPRTMALRAEVQPELKVTPRSSSSSLKRLPTVHLEQSEFVGVVVVEGGAVDGGGIGRCPAPRWCRTAFLS